jgi:RHS repeat-associated protein
MVKNEILIVAALGLSTVTPALALGQDVEYYHLDPRGSVKAVTNHTGALVRRHHYLPFGEEPAAQAATDSRRFVGKERDAETGLDYFGGRYYASHTGRFTSVDPVLDQQASILNPQRWNRYAYGLNNPFRYVDPDGRELKLIVYNSSGLSKDAASRVSASIADKFRDAGVKHVTFEIRAGQPSNLETMRYQTWAPTHEHLVELRSGAAGQPRLRDGLSGLNIVGQAMVNGAEIARVAGRDALETGLANSAAHEVGHRTLNHQDGAMNMMRPDGASDQKWLANRDLRFTPEQSKALQRRYNKPDEK